MSFNQSKIPNSPIKAGSPMKNSPNKTESNQSLKAGSPVKNISKSPISDMMNDPFKTRPKLANSPPLNKTEQSLNASVNNSPPKVSYDLSNLPENAFEEPQKMDETEVVPKILSLSLPERPQKVDTESDTSFIFPQTKEASLSEYNSFVGDETVKMIDSKAFKQRILGLNKLQEKLESLNDLNSVSLPVVRGLEKSPGWAQSNSIVNQLVIDILRHVVVKSDSIKKATLSLIFPFLIEKLSDRKLKTPSSELLHIIAESICPSFVIQQVCDICTTNKGTKGLSPKTIATALDICNDIIVDFGVGNISYNDLRPHLLKLLQHKTAEVKKASTNIAKYLYKKYGAPFEQGLMELSGPIFDRLKAEFETANSLSDPKKKYCRINESVQPTKITIKSTPLSKYISNEDIEGARTTKKWEEQKRFLESIKAGLEKCMSSITSADLGPLLRVMKQYISDGNKNLVYRSLCLLEEIAKAADKGIAKETAILANGLIAAWSDQRANIREQATKTIDAFCVHSGPSIFVKILESMVIKPSSDARLEIVKWIHSHLNEINQSDTEKIIPFILQCAEDRSAATRQSGLQIASVLRNSMPDAFNVALKNLPNSSQREITKHIDSGQQSKKAPSSPEKTKKSQNKANASTANSQATNANVNPPNNEKAVPQNTNEEKSLSSKPVLRFTVTPTQNKKVKRLKQQSASLGLSLILNRQNVQTLIEKLKFDVQSILPPTVAQKLMSSLASDQIEAIQDLNVLFSSDPQLVCMCSDIIVKWLSIRIFEKNTKVIIDGICFLMKIFSEELISLQEMELLVPLILWSSENKTQQVIDSCFDLLFVIRLHSDPSEYSTVLRSCFEICNERSLIHLFDELQFTVTDDPKNPTIFMEIISFLEHKSDEVAAACGGVLALLARRMKADVIASIFDSLSPEKRSILATIVPIESSNSLNFTYFNRLSSIEKVKSCRRLLDLLKAKLPMVQSNCESILKAFLHELCCQETDFSAIRVVLFSIYNLLVYCTFSENDLNCTLQAVTFFGNRWQRKLVLIDGASIAQTINSILFKLFEKIPIITIFNSLLDGMQSFRGSVPPDSFYCKCWAALSNQIEGTLQPGDSEKLIQFAKEKYNEFGPDDIRGKLNNALICILTGRKKITAFGGSQQQKREPLAKSIQNSPGHIINRESKPMSRSSPERQPFESRFTSQRNASTTSKSNEMELAQKPPLTATAISSNSNEANTTTKAKLSPVKTTSNNTNSSSINQNLQNSSKLAQTHQLKERLAMLKQRWGNALEKANE